MLAKPSSQQRNRPSSCPSRHSTMHWRLHRYAFPKHDLFFLPGVVKDKECFLFIFYPIYRKYTYFYLLYVNTQAASFMRSPFALKAAGDMGEGKESTGGDINEEVIEDMSEDTAEALRDASAAGIAPLTPASAASKEATATGSAGHALMHRATLAGVGSAPRQRKVRGVSFAGLPSSSAGVTGAAAYDPHQRLTSALQHRFGAESGGTVEASSPVVGVTHRPSPSPSPSPHALAQPFIGWARRNEKAFAREVALMKIALREVSYVMPCHAKSDHCIYLMRRIWALCKSFI